MRESLTTTNKGNIEISGSAFYHRYFDFFGFEYDVLDILIYDIPVFKVGSNPGHVRSEGLLIRDHFLLEKQTLS